MTHMNAIMNVIQLVLLGIIVSRDSREGELKKEMSRLRDWMTSYYRDAVAVKTGTLLMSDGMYYPVVETRVRKLVEQAVREALRAVEMEEESSALEEKLGDMQKAVDAVIKEVSK